MTGESWGLLKTEKALVFIDNHDTQRGNGYGGTEILTHKEPRRYKVSQYTVVVHSKYNFVYFFFNVIMFFIIK